MIYGRSGFRLKDALMDGQFEPLRMQLAELMIHLNLCATNEHIPEIERAIKLMKERIRAVCNSLPYKKMPVRMIIEMVYNMIYWIDAVPAVDRVSDTQGPSTIITGHKPNYNRHCNLEFGTYCQVYR